MVHLTTPKAEFCPQLPSSEVTERNFTFCEMSIFERLRE